MRDVAVIGAGMTKFGKFLDRSMKDLAGEAVKDALESAGVDKSKLEAAVVGNATAGLITGQEMIRGQVVLREMGIGGIPVINTENACASSSTAFHIAWMYVTSGMYDIALAVGMEKLYHEDKRRSFQANGAAVDVLCAADKAKQFTSKPVFVRASVLTSGADRVPGQPGITERAAQKAYEIAGVGPEDINVAEVHDASAPAELVIYEELGFCKPGEGGQLIDSKATYVDGPIPVNRSGGLISKGHPIGATGVAQIYEIYSQLRGEAGDRQVRNPKVGMTENGGGMVKGEAAALAVHILSV